MKRVTILIFCLFCFAGAAIGQDLDARVQILYPTLPTSNKRIFGALENAIKDFMNSRKWSTDQIQPQERIQCTLVINLTSWDGSSSFTSELQVLSTRPVYGSTYNTNLLAVNDKSFDFSYTEGQLLDYNEQTFYSNLTSVLAFYANMIVGMDYDSFSRFGGTPYFAKCQTIVNAAQSSSYKGWNSFDNSNNNRYWLSQNVNDKRYQNLRDFIYNYHRNGLDLMADNAGNARKNIMAQLAVLPQVDRQSIGSMFPQVFFTAKSDELANLFSGADPQTKIRAYNYLIQADPSNGNKYQVLKN